MDGDKSSSPDSDGDASEGSTKTVSLEIPGAEGEPDRYANITMPVCQYEWIDRIKSNHGCTWRGLAMHTCRLLSDTEIENVEVDEEAENNQYSLMQDIRKRHGLTWKGMLFHGARDLEQDPPHACK
jgi:hypothetical protein